MRRSDKTFNGKAVQIVTQDQDGSFRLQEQTLRRLLQNERVRDKKVCVVSVAGAFRKGKSFLLSFFIRYLTQLEKNGESDEWLGDSDEELCGFKWRGGCERETTGIWAWSRAFVCKKKHLEWCEDTGFTHYSEEEVAVILIDTQGTFDSESTVKDNVTIFALSTLISSTLVYNLSQNIQEDDLQHLQFFTEYGKLATEKCTRKPFQELMFLVRDWQYPHDHAYGIKGGEKFLEKKLNTSGKHNDLTNVREGIKDCFSQLHCFLMPHPGKTVAIGSNFTGKLTEIDEDFRQHLSDLVPLLLSPDTLVEKKMGGQVIKCGELGHCFQTYVKLFQGDKVPTTSTLVQTTAEAQHLLALERSKTWFAEEMDKFCGIEAGYIGADQMETNYEQLRDAAIEKFDTAPKIGGTTICQSYKDDLCGYMSKMFRDYSANNMNKANIFIRAAVAVSRMMGYIVSSENLKKVSKWFRQRAETVTAWYDGTMEFFGRIGNWFTKRLEPIMPHLPEVPKAVCRKMSDLFFTPFVLLMIVMTLSLLSGFTGLIGFTPASKWVDISQSVVIISLCVWIFARLTGKWSGVKALIDSATNLIWTTLCSSADSDQDPTPTPQTIQGSAEGESPDNKEKKE